MKTLRNFRIRALCLTGLCLLGCIPAALQAQFVVTYQGVTGDDADVGIYDPTTTQLVESFMDENVFKVLATSAGSQYFFVSNASVNNAGAPIVVSGTFNIKRHKSFGSFATPVTSAVLSPDDMSLVVGANTVHIFNTSSYGDLVPGGIAIPNAITVTDLAVDYNSQTIYALSAGASQSYLTSISLSSLTILQTVPEPVGSTTLTISPSGLLYVTSPNTITEINPITLAPTPSGILAASLVNPGRPVFTPAGQYLLSADQSPVAGGAAAILLDLNLHAITGTLAFNGLVDPITQLNVISDTMVYALVPGTTTLYVVQIGSNGGLILNTPPFAANLGVATNPGAVTDVAAFSTSQDLGVPGRNAPQFVFVVGAQSPYVYVIDPVSLAIVDQIPWGDSNFEPPGGVTYTAPTLTFNQVTTVLTYGNNQSVPLGGQTLPLVVRALDANGNPVAGVGVDYFVNAPASGGPIDSVLNPPAPYTAVGPHTFLITGAGGYADAFFTAGTLSTDVGPNTVSTDLSNSPPTFTVNVGTSTPAAAAALSIVSGQGQIIFQNPAPNLAINPDTGLPFVPLFASTPLPLTVMATDGSGNPLPNATIVFTILNSDSLASPGASQTVVTNSLGQAAATFPSNNAETQFAPPFAANGFATETIAATTGTLTANFYLTSVTYAVVTTTSCTTPPCVTSVPQMNVQVLSPPYGSVISGSSNSTIPNAVKIIVTSIPASLPIPNVGVSVNTGSSTILPNARCAEPTGSGIILTDSTGTAVCNLLLNNIPGTEPLSIFVPQQSTGITGFATLTVIPNAPATITVVNGNNQFADEGATSPTPFTIEVVDSSNNPIPLTPVTWKVTSGPLTLSSVQTTTDTNGMATAVPVAGSTSGLATVTVTAGGATATFTENVAAAAGDIIIVSGNSQTIPVNSAATAPLVVQLLDQNGNPAPFAGVVFQASGNPALASFAGTTPPGGSSITVATDANGQASASLTATSVPGTLTVTATSVDSLASTFFSLTVLSPSPSGIQVLNAGSLQTSLAPGALIQINGTNVAPTVTGAVTDAATLASSGYTVSVGGVTAPVTGLSNQNGIQQVTAQIPFEVIPGATSLILQTPQGSATADVTINSLAPGILTNGTVTVNGSTFPQALAVRPDGSTVSATNPALQGDTITFTATGLGQTTPTAVTGTPGVPDEIVYAPLFAAVNHLGATVTSAVYTVGTSGTYSITIQIPATAMTGPGQPISIYMIDSSGVAYTAPDVYIPLSAAP